MRRTISFLLSLSLMLLFAGNVYAEKGPVERPLAEHRVFHVIGLIEDQGCENSGDHQVGRQGGNAGPYDAELRKWSGPIDEAVVQRYIYRGPNDIDDHDDAGKAPAGIETGQGRPKDRCPAS